MNQHTSNLSVGYCLSSDDAKQGIRQLDDDKDFEGMICMLKQWIPCSRGHPVTLNIIDLTACDSGGQQDATSRGRATMVVFLFWTVVSCW